MFPLKLSGNIRSTLSNDIDPLTLTQAQELTEVRLRKNRAAHRCWKGHFKINTKMPPALLARIKRNLSQRIMELGVKLLKLN